MRRRKRELLIIIFITWDERRQGKFCTSSSWIGDRRKGYEVSEINSLLIRITFDLKTNHKQSSSPRKKKIGNNAKLYKKNLIITIWKA